MHSGGSIDNRQRVQVALLFLTKDDIPTEPIWTAFITAAAELTLRVRVPPPAPPPVQLLPAIPEHTDEVEATCWPTDYVNYGFSNYTIAGSQWNTFTGTLRFRYVRALRDAAAWRRTVRWCDASVGVQECTGNPVCMGRGDCTRRTPHHVHLETVCVLQARRRHSFQTRRPGCATAAKAAGRARHTQQDLLL